MFNIDMFCMYHFVEDDFLLFMRHYYGFMVGVWYLSGHLSGYWFVFSDFIDFVSVGSVVPNFFRVPHVLVVFWMFSLVGLDLLLNMFSVFHMLSGFKLDIFNLLVDDSWVVYLVNLLNSVVNNTNWVWVNNS